MELIISIIAVIISFVTFLYTVLVEYQYGIINSQSVYGPFFILC